MSSVAARWWHGSCQSATGGWLPFRRELSKLRTQVAGSGLTNCEPAPDAVSIGSRPEKLFMSCVTASSWRGSCRPVTQRRSCRRTPVGGSSSTNCESVRGAISTRLPQGRRSRSSVAANWLLASCRPLPTTPSAPNRRPRERRRSRSAAREATRRSGPPPPHTESRQRTPNHVPLRLGSSGSGRRQTACASAALSPNRRRTCSVTASAARASSRSGFSRNSFSESQQRAAGHGEGHQLPELPGQQPHAFNFGADAPRTNSGQRPPRVPARIERLGHLVLQSTKYVDALNWYLDNLGARNEFDIRRLVGLLKVPTS